LKRRKKGKRRVDGKGSNAKTGRKRGQKNITLFTVFLSCGDQKRTVGAQEKHDERRPKRKKNLRTNRFYDDNDDRGELVKGMSAVYVLGDKEDDYRTRPREDRENIHG